MKRKLTVLIMSACLIASLIPATVFAQSSSKEKADLTISSVKELKQFAKSVSNGNSYKGKNIKLTEDIKFDKTVKNNFKSIGMSNSSDFWDYTEFLGTFDGGGHTISGINQTNGYGLFYEIGTTGVVKNIIIRNCNFKGSLGSIAGINSGEIENCHNESDIVGDAGLGGIVGTNYIDGIVINCSNSGNIITKKSESSSGRFFGTGGIVGTNIGKIQNCYNVGNIFSKSEDDDREHIGGIVGFNDITFIPHSNGDIEAKTGSIENCYNTGKVTAKGEDIDVGGLAGSLGYAIMKNSYYCQDTNKKMIGDDNMEGVKNSKELSSNEMKKYSFVTTLNKNRGSNTSWSKWELTSSSEYPTLVTKYEVTFKSSKLGYTKTNRSYAYAGQTVTLTAVPNKNYKTSTVVVKTASGKKVTVKKVNGKYQFKMPKGKVVITTTFKKK